MNAEIMVPMFTAPKIFVYHNPHIISEIITIVASNPILIVENLQFVIIATDSTHPSPGSGAMFAGMYMNIPSAVKKILIIKKIIIIGIDPLNGMNETMYSARSVKYPNSMQFMNWSSLFFLNFFLRIIN